MSSRLTIGNVREHIVGVEEQVTLLNGARRTYVNFDNASSTPTLDRVLERVNQFMPFYASVGRGSGFKSHLATEEFEAARTTIGGFVGGRPHSHTVILGKNTTEAINKIAHRFPFKKDSIVLTSIMEHHSNDLPWRQVAEVQFINSREDGTLDLDHLRSLLADFGERVALVAVTGASNVTGVVNPIHEIARLAHDAGARISVDAAQLAPHRAIDMKSPDDPEHIDCLAYTGHKMYAPYGIGALVVLKDCLRDGEPDLVGGGTVDFVTEENVYWSGLPNREEAGTPNIVGAIAWAEAIRCLQEIGMDAVAQHESYLAAHFVGKSRLLESFIPYGLQDASLADDYLGVSTFAVHGVHHKLVAAILGFEGGIGVRSGLFCAHPYLLRLQSIPQPEQHRIAEALAVEGISALPGLTRASFGIYNTEQEIDWLIEVLELVASGNTFGDYVPEAETGNYAPKGFAWPKLGADLPPQPGC